MLVSALAYPSSIVHQARRTVCPVDAGAGSRGGRPVYITDIHYGTVFRPVHGGGVTSQVGMEFSLSVLAAAVHQLAVRPSKGPHP